MDIFIFIWWLVFATIATIVGANKGRAGFGFLMGFLLGLIGLIIIIVMPAAGYDCPFCKGTVKKGASICPHCRSNLLEGNTQSGRFV
jgi:hypothetical protein